MGFGKLVAGVAFSLSLATVVQAAPPTKAQIAKVVPGMTRAELITLLGEAQNRLFRGSGEILQYCRNGMFSHEYTTIALRAGKVFSLDIESHAPPILTCTGWFPPYQISDETAGVSAASQSVAPGGGTATGTAFKVGATSLMTAAHVVEGSTKIEVRCPDMAAMPATVAQRSRATDIAVLSVSTASAKWLPVASTADVALGDPVFVIGFPVSDLLGTNARFNDGTVSALSGVDSDASFLQISTPIQPGNSGGPVVSPTRGVVGVVSSTAAAGNFIKNSGGALPQNINFAARADLSLTLDRTLKTGVGPVSVPDALASTCFVQVQLAS